MKKQKADLLQGTLGVLGVEALGARDRLQVAVETDQRVGGDLQVEVGPLRRDEVAQRVIEIESHVDLMNRRAAPTA